MSKLHRTGTAERPYLPAMGKHWLLPFYDTCTWFFGVSDLHHQLLDRADLRPGLRVLEIGCGTGNLLRALGRRVRDIDAVGIDPDPAALRRARRKAARAGLSVRYEQAFAGDLPLPDGSFDRVLSALMLHHLPADERARALGEARRVLRPGGELHVLDIDSPKLPDHRPEPALTAMTEAGLAGVAQNGGATARFGKVAFYRAVAS